MTTRVMVLIDSLLAGGAERVAVELACQLDRRRFDPHVVVTRTSGPLEGRLTQAGVPVTVLGRKHRISLSAYRRARGIARDCDTIHAHKFSSNVWGALLARTTHKPLIAHEHNWSETPSRLRTVLNRRWIAPVTTRFLCVSQPVAAQLSMAAPASAVCVLANPASLGKLLPRAVARQQLGLAPTGFVIGIVARLRPEKNHDLLLRAVAQLIADGRELTVCAVGDGPRRGELVRLADDLGIGANVVWSGQIDDAATVAAAFDVTVLCSRWEGLPLAALEAMTAGVPVVATSVGGLPDLLADDAGVLVAPDDAAALARAIDVLLLDGTRAAQIGSSGRRRVQDRHDPAAVVATVEGFYDEAVQASRADR